MKRTDKREKEAAEQITSGMASVGHITEVLRKRDQARAERGVEGTWRDVTVSVSDAGHVDLRLPDDHAGAETEFRDDEKLPAGRVKLEPGAERVFWLNVGAVRMQFIVRRAS